MIPLFGPGPPGFLSRPFIQIHSGSISGADIAAWPNSVGILCKFTPFLGTHFGVSFLELFILFEQRAGHRFLSETVLRPHLRANRPISFPSVFVSEGIEIRHGCQFISSLVRALAQLPGGIGRFLPCGVGSHLSRLRHLGWNQCSHGFVRLDHWKLVIINASRLFVGFWCIPKEPLRSFQMALLNSDTVPLFLPRGFTHGLYLGLGMVVVKDGMLLLVICLMIEVTLLKGSG